MCNTTSDREVFFYMNNQPMAHSKKLLNDIKEMGHIGQFSKNLAELHVCMNAHSQRKNRYELGLYCQYVLYANHMIYIYIL